MLSLTKQRLQGSMLYASQGATHLRWTSLLECVTFTMLYNALCYMSKIKTATLNLRIDPRVKEGIRIAASRDHRSVANMVEMLIRRYCADTGVRIPEQSELFQENSS